MPTQCNVEQLQFSCVERRQVVAAFDGGMVSSTAGVLLLGGLFPLPSRHIKFARGKLTDAHSPLRPFFVKAPWLARW